MVQRKKKKGRKGGKDGSDADAGERDLLRDDGGFDWGWPSSELVVGAHELSRRLLDGGFVAVGYGALPDGGPFIALLGENPAGMRSALALMREWVDASGPNALRLEIAYDGPGYVLAISQQLDLMRWRISGIDTVAHPLLVAASHIKRLDSRHPILGRLAEYAKGPVAPIVLTVGEVPASARGAAGSTTTEFVPFLEEAILLPGLDVYTDPKQRPLDSMATLGSEVEERKRSPSEWVPPPPPTAPSDIADEREMRLSATFPKTLHVLRHRHDAARLFGDGSLVSLNRWQVEQAVCNLRLPHFLPYAPNSRTKRLKLLESARRSVLEPASAVVDLAASPPERVAAQVSLDAAFLLRRVDEGGEVPELSEARSARLRELGYA